MCSLRELLFYVGAEAEQNSYFRLQDPGAGQRSQRGQCEATEHPITESPRHHTGVVHQVHCWFKVETGYLVVILCVHYVC